MTKMPCSVTDDVMSDPDYRYESPYQDETGMSRMEEMDLRLQAMSQKMHQVMASLGDSNQSLRRDLADIKNGIMLTQIDLDDLDQ